MKTRYLTAGSVALLLLAAPAGAVPTNLASISSPPAGIGNANVRDTNGQIVGAVQRVDITAQGKPVTVSVAMLGGDEKLVVLDAGKVKYDAARNEIITDSSRKQLHFFYGQN